MRDALLKISGADNVALAVIKCWWRAQSFDGYFSGLVKTPGKLSKVSSKASLGSRITNVLRC